MLSESVLSRLSRLNLQTQLAATRRDPPVGQHHGGSQAPFDSLLDSSPSELPSGVETENCYGKHWLRERAVSEFWSNGPEWLSKLLKLRVEKSASSGSVRRELSALAANLPHHVCYLDLETCGFAGSMVFLVGLIEWRDSEFRLAQLLARHYGEEKAMLHTLWQRMRGKRVLVTFNGKSFDWPMVQDRSILHRLEAVSNHQPDRQFSPSILTEDEPEVAAFPTAKLVHCDLLHHARRRWKDRLPDCKLQTLERYVCKRHRSGDIPGREIPAAYHDFVRTGDAWLLRSVLHHNALDLVTLLQLSLRLC
jgi:uncharacterized protein YprB with RNaseH-like and TPR domain